MAGFNDDFDFDAPKHYFDFNAEQDEPDDSYFDCPGDNEVFENKPGSAKRVKSPTSPPMQTPKASPPRQTRVEKPKTPQSAMKSLARPHSMTGRTPNVGVRQSPRLIAIAKAVRRSNAARRSGGFSSTTSASSKGSLGSQLNKVQKPKARRPSVPKVTGMKGLSSRDEEDLAVITNFKNKLAENKKKGDNVSVNTKPGKLVPTKPQEFNFATTSRLRNQKPKDEESNVSMQAAPKPVRLGPTRPQEFHFATDSRVKSHENTEESDPVEFTRLLRSSQSGPTKDKPRGPTIPQPFNLTESRKGKLEENKFVSIAELNLKFHTKTPQRFRSKRGGGGSIEDINAESKKTKGNSGVTIPHTPVLTTRGRSRQVNYLTHEEMEQKEFEEAQKHAFKANPLNKKVFDAPKSGYQVEKKLPTVPQPFNITEVKKSDLPLGHNFREMCNKLGGSTSSVASLPHGGIPSKWDKTSTKPQPFSFDERDKQKLHKKQEMILKVLEEEKKLAEFHAQPMPTFEGIRGVPEKKPPTPTRSQPFNLASDYRGSQKQSQFQKSLEEQAKHDQEQRSFRARSSAVLHKQPFIPEKSKKPLTDISGFTLNTEIRSEERNEFEMHRKRKELELMAAKKEQEERQKIEEEAEVARIRREVVHKANPVPSYKPLLVKPSERNPTIPKSPNFATNTRLRSRSSKADSTMDISSATYTSE